MDRETLSLPVANSQFYTAAVSSITSMLSPIAQTPVENEEKDVFTIVTSSASAPPTSSILITPPVFELTEEVRLDRHREWTFINADDFIFLSLHRNVRLGRKLRKKSACRGHKVLSLLLLRLRSITHRCLVKVATAETR